LASHSGWAVWPAVTLKNTCISAVMPIGSITACLIPQAKTTAMIRVSGPAVPGKRPTSRAAGDQDKAEGDGEVDGKAKQQKRHGFSYQAKNFPKTEIFHGGFSAGQRVLCSKKFDNSLAILAEISQMRTEDFVYHSFFNLPVDMDKKIAKPGHLLQIN